MTKPVQQRLIFHITHLDNLPAILADGHLWSDFEVTSTQRQRTVIGFQTIKNRRMFGLPVSCHPSTNVGHYVPFYFCPRSPMLYVIHRRNRELIYQGGQERIVHLVSQIGVAIQAAEERPWAFSDGNAGAKYARFSNDLARFDELVDWKAVDARYWSDPTIKERKQAEFLVYQKFPWTAFGAIGVANRRVAGAVGELLGSHVHCPKLVVKPDWYY